MALSVTRSLEPAVDPYAVYCFLGLAEAEDRKVFLWPQWEPCFLLLDPLLQPYARTSEIRSHQAFEIPLKSLKSDAPGTRRVTFKTVPMGKLRWTLEDNRAWSQRALEEGEYPIRHIRTRIASSGSKTKPPEIQVNIFNRDATPTSSFNQVLTLSIAEPILRARSAESWRDLVDALSPILRAVRIARTSRPWALSRPRGNATEMSSLADLDFTMRHDSLDLEDSWQSWEYLK